MKHKDLLRYLPVGLFVMVMVFLARGLWLDPQELPSTQINQPVPNFSLSELIAGNPIDQSIFKGHWTILNVWASWCDACVNEHELIKTLSEKGVRVIGLNYKDNARTAKAWLANYGNPYQAVLFDHAGQLAIDLGVYGSPETFIIDPEGIIRYRHVGVLTAKAWQQALLPRIANRRNQSS